MGSKSPATTTVVNQPNPVAMAAYQNVVNQAQNVAKTPYTPYTGQLVAPLNGQQNTAIGNINSAYGVANPYINAATGLAARSTSGVSPMAFNSGNLGQFMSPYQNSVINSTLAEINNQNAQQQQQVVGNAITSGAFGGDRAGVAQAALAGQQALATNSTLANLNNQNYTQALGEFNNQQQTGLAAQQFNNQMAGQGAYTLGALGQEAQNTALTGANAQLQAGALQQGTQQAQNTAAYQQFLNQQAYPFQTTGWLANVVEGVGSNMGGTSTSTQPAPSSLNSIIGGGLSLASMFLARGGRVREKFASGGLAGGGMAVGMEPYADAMGYVPTINLGVGHTMPAGAGSGLGAASQQTPAGMPSINGGLSSLGTAVRNSGGLGALAERYGFLNPIGASDTASAFTGPSALPDGINADIPLPPTFARGGLASGRMAYDDGGVVPSVDDLLFDPNAVTPAGGLGMTAAPASPTAPANVGLEAAAHDDPNFDRMIAVESGGRQFDANGQPLTSPKGAVGIAQVMPSTAPEAAADAGVAFDPVRYRTDPQYNKMLGQAYYNKQLQEFGSPELASAAYNAGPGALRNALAKAQTNGGSYLDYLPGETQKYVSNVMGGPSTAAMVAANPGLAAPAGGALAYDDNGLGAGASPASQAISNAIGGLNGSQNSGSQGTDFLGLPKLSDNARMGLLAAGLGMMASRSPWFGVAAGQGGLQGLNTYMQARNYDLNRARTMGELGYQQGQLGIEQGRLGISQQDVNLRAQQLLKDIAVANAQIGSTNAQTAMRLQTATPAGLLVRDPQNPSAAPRLIPWSQMAVNNRPPVAGSVSNGQPGVPAGIQSGAPSAPVAPVAPNNPIQNTIPGSAAIAPGMNSQNVTPVQNVAQRMPASAQGAPVVPPQSPMGTDGVPNLPIQPPQDLPIDGRMFNPVTAKIASGEAELALKNARTSFEGAQNTIYQIAQMRHDLSQLPANGFLAPGTGQQERNDFTKKINTVLTSLGVSQDHLINPNAVAAGEELKKLTNRMGFDLAKTMGSREAAMIVQQAVGSVPGSENTPLGAKRLLAGLEGMARRQQDYYNFLQNWSMNSGGSIAGADAYFNQVNPPERYVNEAILSTIPQPYIQRLKELGQNPNAIAAFNKRFGSNAANLVFGAH